MALTAVTLEGMRSAHNNMGDTVQSSQTSLRATSATIRGLSSTWTGLSAQGFQRAEGLWEENCAAILRSMEELMARMTESANFYKTGEQTNTDQSSALAQQIGAMAL